LRHTYTLSLPDALPISPCAAHLAHHRDRRVAPARVRRAGGVRRHAAVLSADDPLADLCGGRRADYQSEPADYLRRTHCDVRPPVDRKSTRLNSSHEWIS